MDITNGPDYPIFLYDFEYELIVNRKKKWFHVHDWVYRKATLPDKVGIMSDRPHIEYMQFPSGRYCKKCKHVDLVLGTRVASHTGSRWSKEDFSYLLTPRM